MSLNSIRAPDASRDFALRLNCAEWSSLATVAGRMSVTLDIVTANDCTQCGILSTRKASKKMMDGIFRRFPRLKFIRFLETSPDICSFMISSFLYTYQVLSNSVYNPVVV